MNQYFIVISNEAMADIDEIVDYIHNELQEPYTARRYYDGLISAIQKLSLHAGSIGINSYVQAQFGRNVRHIIYKKMTIIYVICGDVVYVNRIIPNSLIH
ncbi:type II toxin-antitoxin system RelE/ParE family toxin [Viscerimonas tarda]